MSQACTVGVSYRFQIDSSDTCGRAKTNRKSYEWTRIFLRTEKKSYVLKRIRIRVDRASVRYGKTENDLLPLFLLQRFLCCP